MSATAQKLTVAVPDIGDFSNVPVIDVLVAVGDTVTVEDPLVTLESDKATMDVPAPAAGVVTELHVKLGDTVSEGSPLLDLETVAGDAAPSPAAEAPPSPAAEAPPPPAPAPDPARGNSVVSGSAVYASPSVRRLARELGVDLRGVTGTGRKGRLTPDDVRTAHERPAPGAGGAAGLLELGLAPWPVVDFEKFGPVERVQRSRIQRISAANLARNWVMIPHVTHHDEADVTELEAWRRQLNAEHAADGPRFTMVSFLITASVVTLREFPSFNAALDGDELVLRRYFNIGFAADTPQGLVVPVIRDADHKGLAEIARELADLSGKARAGKLTPAEMAGGTFSISSLGGIGGTAFTPIINAPEVAILGVTRAQRRPVWNERDGSFEPRLMLPLSLSYDHRVIDGAAAARFVAHLCLVLGDLRRALL